MTQPQPLLYELRLNQQFTLPAPIFDGVTISSYTVSSRCPFICAVLNASTGLVQAQQPVTTSPPFLPYLASSAQSGFLESGGYAELVYSFIYNGNPTEQVCIVYVLPTPVLTPSAGYANMAIPYLELSPSFASLAIGGNTLQLTGPTFFDSQTGLVYVVPSDVTISAPTWSSSNTALATVSNTGLVTSAGAGPAGQVTVSCSVLFSTLTGFQSPYATVSGSQQLTGQAFITIST
jgi:hypothetical protein